MDINGIYTLCCPHGIYLSGFDFQGGEKGTYPFALYQLGGVRAKILVGDSLCRCSKCFQLAEQLRGVIEPRLPNEWVPLPDSLGVNVMHVLGVRVALASTADAHARKPAAHRVRLTRAHPNSFSTPPSASSTAWPARSCLGCGTLLAPTSSMQSSRPSR